MSNQTELIEAFQRNKIDEARTLLNNPENIPSSLEQFRSSQLFDTLLRAKAFDIVNLFIENKLIDTDIYDYDRLTGSIFETLFRTLKSDEESVAFVKELMPKLSSINDAVANQTLLGLALSERADPAIVKVLIEEGCDVNYVNNAEDNYLHNIAKDRMMPVDTNLAYAQLLIDEGVDVNGGNIVKETPLMTAIASNKKELVELLLQNGARTNEQNKDGETPYYQVVVHQLSYPLYQKLREAEGPDFDKKTNNGEAFFFEYLRRLSTSSPSNIDLLKALIEDGADLHQTSTHYSVEKSAFDALAEKPFDIFETVVKATDLDVNYLDNSGNSLLHKVCGFNVNYDQNMARDTYKKAKLLLEMGADANVTNNQDETPMMLASSDNLKSKTVELLLQHGK